MTLDHSRSPSRSIAEQREYENELASKRIAQVKDLTSAYFAASFAQVFDHQGSQEGLRTKLIGVQEGFFRSFAEAVPVQFDQSEEHLAGVRDALDLNNNHLIIVSNHLPFEKAMSPSVELFNGTLETMGRGDIIQQVTTTLTHVPAVITKRAVISKLMGDLYADQHFEFYVVGGEFGPPIADIQKNDGSIIVPYGKSGTGGSNRLQAGLTRVIEEDLQRKVGSAKPIVVGFPEGGNPPNTRVFKDPFHKGIFGAAAEQAVQGHNVIILPMVMAVGFDFGVVARFLQPVQVLPEHARNGGESLTEDTRAIMFAQYTELNERLAGGYWEGMVYPYGSISRDQIVAAKH